MSGFCNKLFLYFQSYSGASVTLAQFVGCDEKQVMNLSYIYLFISVCIFRVLIVRRIHFCSSTYIFNMCKVGGQM